jgi:hypothetical protein
MRKCLAAVGSAMTMVALAVAPARGLPGNGMGACDGAWKVVPSPSPTSLGDVLNAVSGLSSDDVWAVGASNQPNWTTSLIEHWNGAKWKIVPNPLATTQSGLFGVAAISAGDVWAVGFEALQHTWVPLAMHWNGSKWKVVSTPEQRSGELTAITAFSASDVWAVGFFSNALRVDALSTLTEHWDGSSWSVAPSPNPGRRINFFLAGVSGSSSSDVWAVGSNVGGRDQIAIAIHWDGTAWTASSPVSPTLHTQLFAVAAPSPTEVWAVGEYARNRTRREHGLIELWDGSSWSQASSANPSHRLNELAGAFAVSPSLVWAVGTYAPNNEGHYRGLIERWDGTAWSKLRSPDAGISGAFNILYGVTAPSSNDAWAVGYFVDEQQQERTLVEHYCSSSADAR